MNTMKAVRLFEFGGPDKLRYGDHPMPQVAPSDVLVKVLATSVSRWDIKYRTGEVHEFYGKSTGHHGGIHGRRAFPMPMQLGRDVAGEVAAVGASVTTLAPGDRDRRTPRRPCRGRRAHCRAHFRRKAERAAPSAGRDVDGRSLRTTVTCR